MSFHKWFCWPTKSWKGFHEVTAPCLALIVKLSFIFSHFCFSFPLNWNIAYKSYGLLSCCFLSSTAPWKMAHVHFWVNYLFKVFFFFCKGDAVNGTCELVWEIEIRPVCRFVLQSLAYREHVFLQACTDLLLIKALRH